MIYSSYDKVISISRRAQNYLISWLRPKQRDVDKFVVIENGIDVKKFKNAKPYKKAEICNSFTEKTKLICMVGSFSEAKDQPTLIKSMKSLSKDVHLLLIGEGKLKKENEKLARQLNLEDRIHFLGYRNDIEGLLKTSDIIVLSSYWEGLSLASIEGMTSGKPFVASRVPGLEEVVENYGLLFERGNANELSKIINELLCNNELYKKISTNYFNRANDFEIDDMVGSMISMYRSLL